MKVARATIELPDGLNPLPKPRPLSRPGALDHVVMGLAAIQDGSAELRRGARGVDSAIAWRALELADRSEAAVQELFGEVFGG